MTGVDVERPLRITTVGPRRGIAREVKRPGADASARTVPESLGLAVGKRPDHRAVLTLSPALNYSGTPSRAFHAIIRDRLRNSVGVDRAARDAKFQFQFQFEFWVGSRAAGLQSLEPCHLARRRFTMPIAHNVTTADTLMRRDIIPHLSMFAPFGCCAAADPPRQ